MVAPSPVAESSCISSLCEELERLDRAVPGLARVRVPNHLFLDETHLASCQRAAGLVRTPSPLAELAELESSCSACARDLQDLHLEEDLRWRFSPILELAAALPAMDDRAIGTALKSVCVLEPVLGEALVERVLTHVHTRLAHLLPETGVLYAVSRPIVEDPAWLVQGLHSTSFASLVLLEDHQCPTPVRSLSPLYLQSDVTPELLAAAGPLFFSLLQSGMFGTDAWAAAASLVA